MKKFLITMALISAPIVAQATDLPSKTQTPKFVKSTPMVEWTGFYLGISGSEIWALHNRSNLLSGNAYSYNSSGQLIEGYTGYNYQLNHIVVGLEADLGLSNLKGNDDNQGGTLDVTSLRWTSSLRVRAGYLITDTLLAYVTGGLMHSSFEHYNDGGEGQRIIRATNGSKLGVGLEFAFTPEWFCRLEYNYLDFGKYENKAPTNGNDPFAVENKGKEVRLGISRKFEL